MSVYILTLLQEGLGAEETDEHQVQYYTRFFAGEMLI